MSAAAGARGVWASTDSLETHHVRFAVDRRASLAKRDRCRLEDDPGQDKQQAEVEPRRQGRSILERLLKGSPDLDQLRRAGLSVLNNLAEGSGKLSKKEKSQFYRTSLNSVRECVPMLTILLKERQISAVAHQQLRQEVVHIANMLGRLIASVN